MARQRRKMIAKVKLELEAGRATPAPPVGRDLGPHGVNLAEFCRRYNDATAGQEGRIVPSEVTIYEDRSFDIRLKTPLTSALLREAADVDRGAASPNGKPVGTVTRQQLQRIAEIKMPDLNAASLESAMRTVQGTARSMSIRVSNRPALEWHLKDRGKDFVDG